MKNGLASAVADVLCDNGVQLKSFKRFGIPQVYPGFGNAEELYHLYKIRSGCSLGLCKKPVLSNRCSRLYGIPHCGSLRPAA